jgi:hypothetical protein
MSPLIRKRVSACRRRLNWINLIERASTSLLAGLIVGAVFMLLSRIEELGLAQYAWPGVGLLIMVSMLSALVWAYLTRERNFGAAVAIDQRLQLKERVSTALCYPEPTRAIERAVIEDAEAVARTINPRRHFPLPRQRSFYWCLLPLMIIGALSYFLEPFSLFGSSNEGPKHPEALLTPAEKMAVEKLEKTLKEVIENEELVENTEINKLKVDLDKMLKELKTGKMTRPQVVGELSSMQDRMSERRKALGDKLSPRTPPDFMTDFKYTKEVTDKLEKGKFEDAANQMFKMKEEVEKKMESGEMSPEDREQLAQELNAMAKMVDANSELGQALKAAAQAAANNNVSQMSQQLNQAMQDMQDMQALMSEMAVLNAMESLLNEQKQGMSSKAGKSPGSKPGQAAAGQGGEGGEGKPGQAGQPGQGNKGGAGAGAGSGNGQSDAVRLRGFNEGGRSTARGRGPGMGGGGSGAGGQWQTSDQQTTFQKDQAPQKLDKGKVLAILKVDGPQQKGEATAEFQQVVQQYSQEAEESLDREHIPLHMKKMVGDWFDTLRQKTEQKQEKKEEK